MKLETPKIKKFFSFEKSKEVSGFELKRSDESMKKMEKLIDKNFDMSLLTCGTEFFSEFEDFQQDRPTSTNDTKNINH